MVLFIHCSGNILEIKIIFFFDPKFVLLYQYYDKGQYFDEGQSFTRYIFKPAQKWVGGWVVGDTAYTARPPPINAYSR